MRGEGREVNGGEVMVVKLRWRGAGRKVRAVMVVMGGEVMVVKLRVER